MWGCLLSWGLWRHIWTFSPSKYLDILQAVVTDNYCEHQHTAGVRGEGEVAVRSFQVQVWMFFQEIWRKLLVYLMFEVWSQCRGSVSIDPAELDTTDGRKCYLLSQWWIFWLILTPTLVAGYFSVCLILHYWDWDNLALLNIHQNILPTHITDPLPTPARGKWGSEV